MDTATIISELEAQRQRIEQALTALTAIRRKPGRPKGSKAANVRRGRRRLSAAARKKIALAAKARWAKAKAAGKNSL